MGPEIAGETTTLVPRLAVTSIEVRLVDDPRKPYLRGYADFVLGDSIKVHNCRVYQRPDGRLGVRMPNRPARVGCPACGGATDSDSRHCRSCGKRRHAPRDPAFYPVVVAVRPEFGASLERAILHAYVESFRRAMIAKSA